MAEPKKTASQIALEKYQGERANAQKTLDDARDEFKRATDIADKAIVEEGIARANAERARINMKLEEKGEGVRPDGTVRKANVKGGNNPNWNKAKLDLEAAEREELKAQQTRDMADGKRKAAKAMTEAAEGKVAEISDTPVRAARDAESVEALRATGINVAATLAGAGIAGATARKHGAQIAKASKEIAALLPVANPMNPTGRAAMERLKGVMEGLKRTGALDASVKARAMGVATVGAGALLALTMYGADRARANGYDGAAQALDIMNRIEQGAIAVYGYSTISAMKSASSGKPLGTVSQTATMVEAESKIAQADKIDKRARTSKSDRAAVKAAKLEAKKAEATAKKAEKLAKQKVREAEKAKSVASRNAKREASRIIRETTKAKAVAAARKTRVANLKGQSFTEGRSKGRAEVRTEVKVARQAQARTQAAATRAATAKVQAFDTGRVTGRREAFREARVTIDRMAGRVKPGQTLPTQAKAEPTSTMKQQVALAKQVQARDARVGKMIADAGMATKAPAISGASIAKGARAAGKVGAAMMAVAAVTTAAKAFTNGATEKQPWVKVDGTATQGTPAQIEQWTRQKAK